MNEPGSERTPKSIRVFISHSHHDRKMAGLIKTVLEIYFGLEVFVAHDDIEPTAIFEDQIIEELTATDVVIAVLSKQFKNSKYCDQEVGIAFDRGKYIIPINWGLNPYGFIAKFQSLPCKITTTDLLLWIDFCQTVVNLIEKQLKFKGKTIDLMIKAFKNSNTYQTSKRIAKLLNAITTYTSLQLNQIFSAYLANPQIHDEAYDVPYLMKSLIKKNGKKIDPNLLLQYEALSADL